MDRDKRDELTRAFKEREHPRGIFRITCPGSGQVWVDSSPNLPSAENRFQFFLKTGTSLNRGVLTALQAHGPGAFVFEVLEEVDIELSGLRLNRVLKDRRVHWRRELGAESLYR